MMKKIKDFTPGDSLEKTIRKIYKCLVEIYKEYDNHKMYISDFEKLDEYYAQKLAQLEQEIEDLKNKLDN